MWSNCWLNKEWRIKHPQRKPRHRSGYVTNTDVPAGCHQGFGGLVMLKNVAPQSPAEKEARVLAYIRRQEAIDAKYGADSNPAVSLFDPPLTLAELG